MTGCENDLQKVNELTKEYEVAVETGRNVEMFYSEKGVVRVKIEGPLLKRHKTEEPFVEFPEGLKITFYNEAHEVNSILRADYAIRYEKKMEAFLQDNVVLTNDQDERLETDELYWLEKEARIYGDKPVRITTPRETIYGKSGFEADQDFTTYTIKEIVDSEVLINKTKFDK